ncbi:restriction endonuclease subunit S [Wenzhouxiangella sp. AB-CW3]|nr:restriction endonuclease subunit S [Wenzhouxiangella sp. AB-CW3]QOC22751.1 restriction endonuclease subunit S [Wenzhouxiangella sp. AB-CW3]
MEEQAVRDAPAGYKAAADVATREDVPPGYKRTEVGVIPRDWHSRSLQSVGIDPAVKAGPFGSSLTKASYSQSGYKVYGQEQVIRGDHHFGDYFIGEEKYRQLRSCSVRPRDVLISLVGTAGKALLIPDDAPPGIINPRLVRVRLNQEQVDPPFFKHLFESSQVQGALIGHAQGGTMDVLNARILRDLRLPIPMLFEQRAIATALSDADALIESLDRLIAKKRAIKQAAMQQLLTGQTRLPGFTGGWETKRLGDVGTFYKGQGIRRDDVSNEGVPCIRYGEIYTRYGDCVLTPESRIPKTVAEAAFPLRTGDILFAGSGETAEEIGMCVAYLGEQPAFAGGDIVVLRPNEGVSAYLGRLLNHPTIAQEKARLGQGDAVVHISARNLAQIEVQMPRQEEQTAIATVLSDIDTEIEALEHRRDKARQIKQGMMQQLLTGRVRLVEPELSKEATA